MEWDPISWEPTKKSRNYTSGMVQSWNKFCFTGGVLEISVQLPGHPGSGGTVGNYLLEVFPGFYVASRSRLVAGSLVDGQSGSSRIRGFNIGICVSLITYLITD